MEDDVIITDSDGIANSIDKHFCGIGEQPNSNIPNKSNPFINENLLNVRTAFRFLPLTPVQLIKIMPQFTTSKGFGVDNISSFSLKKGMPILASNLKELLNLSMSIGPFPDSWDGDRLSPIYKDGPTVDRSN